MLSGINQPYVMDERLWGEIRTLLRAQHEVVSFSESCTHGES
jgi:hypothetical protein